MCGDRDNDAREMAGRSGAAAIELELAEAAKTFDALAVAAKLRDSALDNGDDLASALEAVRKQKPQMIQREGEAYMQFADTPVEQPIKKTDVSEEAGSGGCGMEIHWFLDDRGSTVVAGVSLYLE